MLDFAWLPLDQLSFEPWLSTVQQYGYWAVFVGILLENTGLPIPGETITLTGGFLAGHNQLNVWGVWLAAFVGAMTGDSMGYWIGATGGWPLLVRIGRFFRLSDQQLHTIRAEFQKNADQAVLLGRFLTLLRIFAGPLAGLAQMPYPRFLVLNMIGALAWASVMVTVAYVAGQLLSLEVLLSHMTKVALICLVTFGGWIGFQYWLERKPVSDSRDSA